MLFGNFLILNGIVTALFCPLANSHLIFVLSEVSFPVTDETIFVKHKNKATMLFKLNLLQILSSSGLERIHIVAWKPFKKSQCLITFRNWSQDYRKKKYYYPYRYKKDRDAIWQNKFSLTLGHVYTWLLKLPFFFFWFKGFKVILKMVFYTIN